MFEDLFAPYGVVRTADLVARGVSRQQVSRLVTCGDWVRLSRGWISNGDVEPTIGLAVRSGAAVTCVSALRRLRVWTPPGSAVHLRYSDRSPSRRKVGSRSCAPAGPPVPRHRPVDGLRTALEAAAGCLRPDDLTAVIDSVLNRSLADLELVRDWFDRYPRRVRDAVRRCDATAESGTESLARIRLRRLRIKVRTQYEIAGVGRVDLLIGDRLVVEVDSKEHHTSLRAYESDRARDRRLRMLGYEPFRVTYDAVMYRWDELEREILTIVRRGAHRWPRTRDRKSGAWSG